MEETDKMVAMALMDVMELTAKKFTWTIEPSKIWSTFKNIVGVKNHYSKNSIIFGKCLVLSTLKQFKHIARKEKKDLKEVMQA